MMSISRGDLEAGRIDLAEVATGEMMPPVTPGDVLRSEFMEPSGLTQHALAKAIGVGPIRVSEILRGKRSITADTALRLAALFGTTPRFWLNLQADYDLLDAERRVGADIRTKIRPVGDA